MVFPDALRAIAALMVVLPHSIGLFAYFASPGTVTRAVMTVSAWGVYGVQIFFVLSGFVIAYTFRGQRVTLRSTAWFALRRSVRLDPPYWCAMVLSLAFGLLRWKTSGVPLPSVPAILLHLLYLQRIFDAPTMNGAFWTLCIEIQFYLVFCAFMWIAQAIARRTPASVPLVGAICFCASLAVPAAGIEPDMAAWFYVWWYAFLAGAVVWWTADGQLSLRLALGCMALLGVVAVCRHHAGTSVVWASAGSLLCCAKVGGLYRWLRYRPVQLVGRWSYCIYLVHIPVAGTCLALLTRMHPRHEIWAYVGLACVYGLTLVTAALLHKLVELPALRWSQRLKTLQERRPPIMQVEDPASV